MLWESERRARASDEPLVSAQPSYIGHSLASSTSGLAAIRAAPLQEPCAGNMCTSLDDSDSTSMVHPYNGPCESRDFFLTGLAIGPTLSAQFRLSRQPCAAGILRSSRDRGIIPACEKVRLPGARLQMQFHVHSADATVYFECHFSPERWTRRQAGRSGPPRAAW